MTTIESQYAAGVGLSGFPPLSHFIPPTSLKGSLMLIQQMRTLRPRKVMNIAKLTKSISNTHNSNPN